MSCFGISAHLKDRMVDKIVALKEQFHSVLDLPKRHVFFFKSNSMPFATLNIDDKHHRHFEVIKNILREHTVSPGSYW